MKSLLLAVAVLVCLVISPVSAADVVLTSGVGVGIFEDAREQYPNHDLGTFHRSFDSVPLSLGVRFVDGPWTIDFSATKEGFGAPEFWEEGLEKGRNGVHGDFKSSVFEADVSVRRRVGKVFGIGGGLTVLSFGSDWKYPGCCSEEYINGTIRSTEDYRYLAPKITVSAGSSRGKFRYGVTADAYPWLRRSDRSHFGLMGKADGWGMGVVSHGNGVRFRAEASTQVAERVSVDVSYQVRKTWIDDGSRLFSWEHKRFHNTTAGRFSIGFSYRL